MTVKLYSPHLTELLQALQYQGRFNDCAPFTIATVTNALQKTDLKGRELGLKMNKARWHGPIPIIRRVPNWATFPWGMADVFREHQLKARWRFLVSTKYLKNNLEKGHILMPIIASWRPMWAHVMTLIAWDELRGWGFANTQSAQQQIYWMHNSHFQKRWANLGHLLVEIPVSKLA